MHASSATETYTLSLHDALPIYQDVALAAGDVGGRIGVRGIGEQVVGALARVPTFLDRKSTRLNSSHVAISYADFCLQKKRLPNSPRTPPRLLMLMGQRVWASA